LFNDETDDRMLARAERIDDKLLLITHMPDHTPWEIVAHYKSLADIERGFRVLKSEIEIAPVFHRLPNRIRPPDPETSGHAVSVPQRQRAGRHDRTAARTVRRRGPADPCEKRRVVPILEAGFEIKQSLGGLSVELGSAGSVA
jgi:hypothetical protein